jgi:dihydroorotase-like cyclic amidohydrolase
MGSLGSTVQNLSIKNEIHICESQILIRNCKINNIYINSTSKPLRDIIITDNTINSISNGQISISEIIASQSFPVTNLIINNNRIESRSKYSIYFSKQIQGEIYNNILNGKIFSDGTKMLKNTIEKDKKNILLTLL